MPRKSTEVIRNTFGVCSNTTSDCTNDTQLIVRGVHTIAIGLSRLRECVFDNTATNENLNEELLPFFDHAGPLAVCPRCNRAIFLNFQTKCQFIFSIIVNWMEACVFFEGAFELPNIAQIMEIIDRDDFWVELEIGCPRCGTEGVKIMINRDIIGISKTLKLTN